MAGDLGPDAVEGLECSLRGPRLAQLGMGREKRTLTRRVSGKLTPRMKT